MIDRSFSAAQVDDAERAHLANGLGRLVRRLRTSAGMTQQQVADVAGCDVRSVRRLEHGECRPRVSFLSAVAAALLPDDAPALLAELRAAAGTSIAADTPRSMRRRLRSVERAARRRATHLEPPAAPGVAA